MLPVEIPEAEDIVQRFKVNVVIDQDFVEEQDGGVPFILRAMTAGSNIRLKIEYSDHAVARNLQVVVQDWVESLEVTKVPYFYKSMESRSEFLNAFVPYFFVAASLYGLSRYSYPAETESAVSKLLIALSITTLMFIVGRFLIGQLYTQMQIAKPLTFISLTAGDRSRREKFRKKQSRKAWLVSIIGVTIICGIGVNIFSTLLVEWWRS